ncbi:Cu2+-exporting ATPase [Halovenus aranensis]|uniref:Cu2+-exporting ATPase n=1 Tax=Halovenus aranensis TaxID=890420 RepID=A0A1G8T197_9EURY|nr:heavy metal translocating P-type ATPase [Halovenus aranensis]SDJ35217.1 Cu2+-exporting ATPase [Halovenus aranensis]
MTDNSCTLCDLPVGTAPVESDGGEQFCCRGCLGVYQTLEDRDDLSADDDVEAIQATLEADDDVPEAYETTFLRIDGMHCTTCETFIEGRASQDDGVASVDASYITDTVRIAHDPETVDEPSLRDQLTGLGYRAYARDDPMGERQAKDDILMRLIVGVLFGMAVMMMYLAVVYPTYFDGGLYYPAGQAEMLEEMIASTSASYFFVAMGVLTSIVLFYTGGPILKGAYVSLEMRQPNMDLLVALAAGAAWAYSTFAIFVGESHIYYDVTVGIIVVVTAGSYYENDIKGRATEKLADLTEAQVEKARRYDGTGATDMVSVDAVAPGDRLLVKNGERIPVDGTVSEGDGTVDEAVVTGESRPVPKREGDTVVGGSLLAEGSLVVEVGESADSSIGRITDMVWDLQSANHGVQQLADRLATVFVPVVLVFAVVVAVVHAGLGATPSETLLVALTVLIVSCPCALGLATPLAIASSVREALERGIVVFDETIFERLRDVDTVVFDKTGTLTTGEMRVVDTTGDEHTLERAALLETRSSHPIAEAIADAYGTDEVAPDGGVVESAEADDSRQGRVSAFESYPTGVGGTVDGTDVLVGHPDLFAERGWTVPQRFTEPLDDARADGHVPVVVGEDGTATGVVVVGDSPRENWNTTVERLDERGVEVAILTGDDERATTRFSDHPGVDHVFAGVPPEGKAETVRQLGAGKQTVMVGDGTNDAPALAQADLGIALGSGTALAADAADVAIVTDDLDSLETVFELARGANRRVKQNIGWALCYNAVAIPLAVTGIINPLFAAVAMGTSSLLVVTNSSRELLSS